MTFKKHYWISETDIYFHGKCWQQNIEDLSFTLSPSCVQTFRSYLESLAFVRRCLQSQVVSKWNMCMKPVKKMLITFCPGWGSNPRPSTQTSNTLPRRYKSLLVPQGSQVCIIPNTTTCIWASSRDYGTYHKGDQQSLEVEEESDQISNT